MYSNLCPLLLLLFVCIFGTECQFDTEFDMDNDIHDECHHQTKFTEKELDAVLYYLQERFGRTGPRKPPCKKLHVRKNFKCLSKKEIAEFVEVNKALYDNGVMDLLSLVHGTYWPYIHKFGEVVPWHRWHINQFEKEMKKINPNISLPYWVCFTIRSKPEVCKGGIARISP